MKTIGSGASRAGGEDFGNEDAFLVEDGLGLYVVCDGSSVARSGEIASRLAVAALEEFIERAEAEFGESLWRAVASRSFADRAIRYAMHAVFRKGQSDPVVAGMATTVTMLLTHGQYGTIGHVGDSRAYLIRGEAIQQLTTDQEWTVPQTDGGGSISEDVDTFSIALESYDTVLLCTDGAEYVIEKAPEVLRKAVEISPRILADRIVSAAHLEDPGQDATVVVVRVRAEIENAWLWLSDIPQPTRFGHTVPMAS